MYSSLRSFLTSALQCIIVFAAMLSVNSASAQCTATLTVNATSSCEDSTFTLTASPSGLYDYQWFVNGQLGPLGNEVWNYYAYQPGTYTFEVQITDNNNCTVISNPVTITVHPNPYVDAPYNMSVCPGATLQLNSTSNIGTSFAWTGPNGFTSALQNPSLPNFQAVNAGEYAVVATFNGCNSHPHEVNVDTVSATPAVTAYVNQYYGGNNSLCEGEAFMLTAEAVGFTSGTYSWTGPNNYTNTGSIFWVSGTSVANSGVYTVTHSGNSCNGPVTVTDTVLVQIHDAPVDSLVTNSPICAGNTLQITAYGPGGTFDWTGPNGFTNNTQLNPSIPNAQPVNSGEYAIHAVLGACEMTETIDVVVMGNTPVLNTIIGSSGIKCAGDHVQMYVLGVTDMTNPTYLWTGPNMSSVNQYEIFQVSNNLDSGQYILAVSGMGCPGMITVYDTFTLDVRPCVWPGDVNNDLVTDNFDVLDLGLGYGTMGPVRTGASYTWEGQYTGDWGVMQFCGVDMKFADCNGNGIITASDTFGIALNYSETHQKGFHIPQAKSTADPDLYFDMSGIVLTPGAMVSIPIKLGTTTIPMVDVYGLAAQVKINGITPPEGLSISAPAGWMGSIVDALNFTKWINTNQTDWAYVRTDHNNANGSGTIAMLHFEVPAGTQYQQVEMYFDNVRIIGNTGNIITDVNILDDTVVIYPASVAIAETIINDVVVVPNPSDGYATLQVSALKETNLHVYITDVVGRNVWSSDMQSVKGIQKLSLPAAELASGIYTIQVKDDKGAIAKTLKWVKK